MSWGITLVAAALCVVVSLLCGPVTPRDELVRAPIACRTPQAITTWGEAEDAAPTMAMVRD